LKAEEFARLKHEIGTRQTYVDKAFAMLDDFVQKHDDQAGRDTSSEIARKDVGEKIVLLERLMKRPVGELKMPATGSLPC
jgi:hypothetical protein